jgi:hypothetical protein
MEVTGNFSDFYGTSMLPALRAIVDDGYKQYTPQFPSIFNVLSSSRSLEQFTQVSGVGRFSQLNEGEAIRRDMAVQGFKSSFIHSRWGLSVPVTVDMVEDDKWDLVGKLHRDLGWSCSETQELDAVSTFNNGFSGSFLGPDGVALFSASHPLYKAGGVQSNVLSVAADLDMIPLQLMLTQFSLQKRASGEFIHAVPRNLVIHPSNLWLAHALTKSTDDPTTADRSINPLGAAPDGIPKPFAWRYLTDTDAWFITSEPARTGLVWFWRKRPYTKSWTDDETEVGVTGMRYKKSHGWNDYIGVMGTPGA